MGNNTQSRLFGQIAIKLGLVTNEQVIDALKEQQSSESDKPKHIGVCLFEKGLLTKKDISVILEYQKKYLEKISSNNPNSKTDETPENNEAACENKSTSGSQDTLQNTKSEPTKYRPYKFNNKEYYAFDELAEQLGLNWKQAISDFESGRLRDWIVRELHDKNAQELIEDLKKDDKLSADEKLFEFLCRISHKYPFIIYGNLITSEYLTGISEMILANKASDDDKKLLLDLIDKKYIQKYYELNDQDAEYEKYYKEILNECQRIPKEHQKSEYYSNIFLINLSEEYRNVMKENIRKIFENNVLVECIEGYNSIEEAVAAAKSIYLGGNNDGHAIVMLIHGTYGSFITNAKFDEIINDVKKEYSKAGKPSEYENFIKNNPIEYTNVFYRKLLEFEKSLQPSTIHVASSKLNHKCPKCGFIETNPNVRFCSECGNKFHKIQQSEGNCAKCGHPLMGNRNIFNRLFYVLLHFVFIFFGEKNRKIEFCSECGGLIEPDAKKFVSIAEPIIITILSISGTVIILGGIFAYQNNVTFYEIFGIDFWTGLWYKLTRGIPFEVIGFAFFLVFLILGIYIYSKLKRPDFSRETRSNIQESKNQHYAKSAYKICSKCGFEEQNLQAEFCSECGCKTFEIHPKKKSIFADWFIPKIQNYVKLFWASFHSMRISFLRASNTKKILLIIPLLLFLGAAYAYMKPHSNTRPYTNQQAKFITSVEHYGWRYDPKQDLWLPSTNISFYNTGDSDITLLEIKVQYVCYSDIKSEEVFEIRNIPPGRSKSIIFNGDRGYNGYTFPEAAKSWNIDIFKKNDNKWVTELHYAPDTFVQTK